MSKEEIMKTIEMIDEQLEKNKEVIDAYSRQTVSGNSDVLTLCMLSKNLMIARDAWKNMLWYEYGIYYM